MPVKNIKIPDVKGMQGVTGRVVTEDQVPIRNAVVRISDKDKKKFKEGVFTERDGSYKMLTVAGPSNFICTAEGFEPLLVIDVNIEADKFKPLDFVMVAETSAELQQPVKHSFVIENFKVDGDTEKKVGSFTGEDPLPISLTPSRGKKTANDIFYKQIKKVHDNDFFKKYVAAMDAVLQGSPDTLNLFANGDGSEKTKQTIKRIDKNHLPFNRAEAYSLLKFATEKYVEMKLGLDVTTLSGYVDNGRLPYYDLIIDRIKEFVTLEEEQDDENFFSLKDQPILIELIWSYWHEEGMLVQTMNALSRRFQNIRTGDRDPLANLELDPLRPLNNILWGYIQDTQHRLTITRRSYEYDHNYGL